MLDAIYQLKKSAQIQDKFSFAVILIFFLVGLNNCSIRKIVVNQLEPVVDEMQISILNEPEEIFAKGSLPFAIKLAEALHHYYPKSSYYSGKLAMLYGAYTFAYFDDTPYDDFDESADANIERLLKLYNRAYNYGLKSMDRRIKNFSDQVLNPQAVNELMKEVKKNDVETLFWFNFAWAMKIFHQLHDTQQLAHLETVKKISDRINILDSDYFFGINTSIYIAYYGGRVDVLGGDKTKALKYYELNRKAYGNKSLIADFVFFRYVTIQNPTPKEFEIFYKRIKKFDVTKNPDFQFINNLLKKKADALYQKKSFLF